MGLPKLTIEEMQKISKSRNGKCLSKRYVNAQTELKWQCDKGHVWYAIPLSIKTHKTWCPYCSHRVKLTIQEMRNIAKSRGGKLLSENYVDSQTNLKWQCKEGHVWEAPPGTIKAGRWCRKCAGTLKLTLEEVQNRAKSRSGKCLSNNYVSSGKKLKWQCKEGHVWEATQNNIQRGSWCPYCSQRIGERVCKKYFERMFGKKFLHVKPKWLETPNGARLELDGYCEELKLAFEYHGKQHYAKIKFFQEKTDFGKRKKYDKLKRKLCKTNGITLITIPYWVELAKIGEYVIQECGRNGIEVPKKDVRLESFDFYCREILEELQEISKSRGGELLSKSYFGGKTKLTWQCKEGHVWEATPEHVKSETCGTWCRKCAGTAKLTIEEMQRIAIARGGKCLSTMYVNQKTKLKWQCRNGHVWYAGSGDIKSGKWCAECAHVKKLTIEEMKKLAESRGGECLSKKYTDANSKLKWRCNEGHTWYATPSNVKSRHSWCPKCGLKIGGMKQRLTIEEMRKIAKSMGGQCLSKKYVNARTNLRWRCKEGHVWEARPCNVNAGRWCHECAYKIGIITRRKNAVRL